MFTQQHEMSVFQLTLEKIGKIRESLKTIERWYSRFMNYHEFVREIRVKEIDKINFASGFLLQSCIMLDERNICAAVTAIEIRIH